VLLFVSQYALPHLRKTKGSIVNISSVSEDTAQAGSVPYVSAKGAVSAMTRALAVDESWNGVRVNKVCPGVVWTALNEKLARDSGDYDASSSTMQNLSVSILHGTSP
jgi:NAD(P)-dependent dehydrogenase (short-subunit alcohol dehydrogenase family)